MSTIEKTLDDNRRIDSDLANLGFSVGEEVVHYLYGRGTIVGSVNGASTSVCVVFGHAALRALTPFWPKKASDINSQYHDFIKQNRIWETTHTGCRKVDYGEDERIYRDLANRGLIIGDVVYVGQSKGCVAGITKSGNLIVHVAEITQKVMDHPSVDYATPGVHSCAKLDKNGKFIMVPAAGVSIARLATFSSSEEEILAKLGLKIGQRVYWDCAPDKLVRVCKVVGCRGDQLLLTDEFQSGLKSSKIIYQPQNTDSSPPTFLLSRGNITTEEERELKEAKVVELLAKDGLKIGDTVYLDLYPDNNFVVVGHDGKTPILAYGHGLRTHAPFNYISNSGSINRRYIQLADGAFSMARNFIKTIKERNAILNKVDVNDRLKKAGFELGEEVVEFSNHSMTIGRVLGITTLGDLIVSCHVLYQNQYLASLPESERNSVSPTYKSSISNVAKCISPGMIQKKSVVDNNARIAQEVKRLGFFLGESVQYSYYDKIILGKVVGANFGGDLVIEASQENGGYYSNILAKDVHPQYKDQSLFYRYCSSAYIKKISKTAPEVKNTTSTTKAPVKPIKLELKKAGYRIVAKQTVKLTHGMLISLLKNKGTSAGKLQALTTLLASEYGQAAMGLVAGVALQYKYDSDEEKCLNSGLETKIPSDHLLHLAKEFRVAAMTQAANELIETIFKAALEVVLSQENSSKIRVEASEDDFLESHLLEEDTLDNNQKLTG